MMMTTPSTTISDQEKAGPPPGDAEPTATDFESGAPRVDVVDLSQIVGERQTLQTMSFSARSGELLAIAGGSGAGKTTLLDAIAGVRPATAGMVLVDGHKLGRNEQHGAGFGYVPQDDIIHTELPLRRTLEHAARLRLPAGADSKKIASAVDRVLDQLDIADRDTVPVSSLSGGQRKRASIAVELLTDPSLFFLDEPTSGLDPATAAELMRLLRRLASRGTTIIMTTHAPTDLAQCDRVVFLAADGHLAFAGSPQAAKEYFEVAALEGVYDQLAATPEPGIWQDRFETERTTCLACDKAEAPPEPSSTRRTVGGVGGFRQWRALTLRNFDLVRHNKLTIAILLGSPAMIVGMMAVLFRPGNFAPDQISPIPAIQTLFWVAFASFFFGVTYGLLQVVGEFAIFRRERFGGLSIGAYVTSKVTILLPLLLVVNVVMLAILRLLDRLPAASMQASASLLTTLVLVSLVAVSIGLLASAAVQNPAQATLALPMLCFPQVLFAGAVVPISEMAPAGRIMSFGLANRWGFESLGRTLNLSEQVGTESGTGGYMDALSGPAWTGWLILIAISVAALAGSVAVLHHRSRVVTP
jgi:ABC-type multidrug transport system ATPase subunit